MIKDSNKVQTEQLDQNKGYIQITYLEPYFDEYELGLQERTTKYDRSFNIRKLKLSLHLYVANMAIKLVRYKSKGRVKVVSHSQTAFFHF